MRRIIKNGTNIFPENIEKFKIRIYINKIYSYLYTYNKQLIFLFKISD